MLRQLGFALYIPTVLTFLSGLSLRFVGKPRRESPTLEDGRPALARLLAELALYDVELQYRYAPVILAGAAIATAILCCGPVPTYEAVEGEADGSATNHSALEVQHALLLEDLASYCPGTCCLDGVVRNAELDILHFWLEVSQSAGPLGQHYEHLRQRHARHWHVQQGGLRNAAARQLEAASPIDGLNRFHALYQNYHLRA